MTNHNKARGNKFESDVVTFLREHGQPKAARTLAGSSEDRGDIQGVDDWALQLKAHKSYSFGPWTDEAAQQATNGHNSKYAVIAKRRGRGDIGESFVVIPLHVWVRTLDQ